MNVMNHFRMSDLTTPRELTDANLNDREKLDREKLELGLESRTTCCFSVVPTDCMNGICGHGTHESQESWDEDGPCTEYQPSDILSHPGCLNLRSRHIAQWESRDAWEKTQCRWTD